jgi:hypothetical protein
MVALLAKEDKMQCGLKTRQIKKGSLESEFFVYLGRFVGYEIHGQKHRQVQQFPDLAAMTTKTNQRDRSMKWFDYLPNGFQSFVALASLGPQGDTEVVSTDGNHRATDFIVGILFANDR